MIILSYQHWDLISIYHKNAQIAKHHIRSQYSETMDRANLELVMGTHGADL